MKNTTHPLGMLLTALAFAAAKHSRQRRKDSEATPYINHPIAVAATVARAGGVEDLATLQAAVLHDTIEDTQTTAEELERIFGAEVCALVKELTDDRSLPKQERKQKQIEHAPSLPMKAKQIKLADKICNLGDITPTQPHDWSPERKREYLDWAERVAAGCRGANAGLEREFDAVLAARRAALGLVATGPNP